MTPRSTEQRDKVNAITRATERGHVIRDVDENTEPVAPGIFAKCVECNATLRYYHGSIRGEGTLTWCPESPMAQQQQPLTTPAQADINPTASLNEWSALCHSDAIDKGWWIANESGNRCVGDLLMLMVTEISEAYEEYRDGHQPTEFYYHADAQGNPKPEGLPIELADLFIRLADFCGYYGIDLESAVAIKLAYNRTRPHRHGGKVT